MHYSEEIIRAYPHLQNKKTINKSMTTCKHFAMVQFVAEIKVMPVTQNNDFSILTLNPRLIVQRVKLNQEEE